METNMSVSKSFARVLYKDITCMCVSHSVVSDSVTPQTSLSMGFSRQEYWSGLLFLLQRIFPTHLLHCRQILYHLSYREVLKM